MDQFDENFLREGDDYYYDARPFYTDQVFNSRDEVMEWAQTTGQSLGYVLVTKRSNKNVGGEYTKTIFMCDRGGVYKGKGSSSSRATGTKRINCPFELEAYFMEHCGWRIYVINHRHNHHPAFAFEGHVFARRMSQAEKDYVTRSAKLNLAPRDILKNLKQEFPDNMSIIKDIYNTIAAMKHNEAQQVGQTPMQVLMGMLHNRNYTCEFTTDDVENPTKYESNKEFYDDIFSAQDHIEESLRVSQTPRPQRDWMTWPEGGIIFANRFGCIVHCLSMRESTTVFPFFIAQDDILPHRVYTVALVNDNHYVMVELINNYPMPPISFHWTLRRWDVAAGWEDVYRDRLQRYRELTYVPPKYVDITSDGSQFWPFA